MTRVERKRNSFLKQTEIVELRARGISNRQIAERYNVSEPRATKLYQDGLRRIGEPVISLERARSLQVTDLALRKLWLQEREPPPARVITHPDGRVENIYDQDSHTKLMLAILKWEEHRARLCDLYSEIRVKVDAVERPTTYDEMLAALRSVILSPAVAPAIETTASVVPGNTSELRAAILNGNT